ncbi:hypothetical protein RclHR1_01810013 [Rhizophagus clarus]|uniref:Protein kinase domain-containing protein n=1 Tax=Rhizophagus clarus TaxID=94130 RepID=A0A2Z6QLU6_9GLOM|nr:hypothetical protein RclHR1_01810013 [Rhizophagus clarus]
MSYEKRRICEKCSEQFVEPEWCKTCQLNFLNCLKESFTSGNKTIDDFIKLMQLKVNNYSDIVFEWIPYDQCPNERVALKCVYNTHNIMSEFLNEAKAYSINGAYNGILQIHGISQNPDTKDYIFVLEYAGGGNLNDWMKRNYKTFDWSNKILVLSYIIKGIKKIHQSQMFRRDLNTKNILFGHNGDIYFRHVFMQRNQPELNEPEAPECYINLMKRCWDPNPENRPSAVEIKETIMLFYYSYVSFIKKGKVHDDHEIERQFKKAEEHRKAEEYKKDKEYKFEPKSITKITEQEVSHVEHSEFIIPDDLAI